VLVEWAVTLRERTAGEEHLGRRAAVAGRTLREVTLFRTGERREEDGNNEVAALSRYFRRDIQVAQDQLVVRAGPYAAVRHPAYAGNLLMLAGLGVALANWASLAALVVIPVAGHLPRIRVEDALLIDRLGDPYRDYAATTARLVPGVW
jgi:hypothetical protein